MTWKKTIFKRRDTENVMIWWLERSLIGGEKELKTPWSDDLKKLLFKRKDAKIGRIWRFEYSNIQEKIYQKIYELLTWKKPILR